MTKLSVAAATVNDTDTGSLAVSLTDSTGALLTALSNQVASGLVAGASGNSASIVTGNLHELCVYLSVSAASGTSPTLFLTIDTSPDGGVTWFTVAATNVLSAAGTTYKSACAGQGSGFGPLVRVRWQMGGTTPSFTFSAWITGRP